MRHKRGPDKGPMQRPHGGHRTRRPRDIHPRTLRFGSRLIAGINPDRHHGRRRHRHGFRPAASQQAIAGNRSPSPARKHCAGFTLRPPASHGMNTGCGTAWTRRRWIVCNCGGAPVSGRQFLAFRLLRGGFRAPVSAGGFPISVSAVQRPVRLLTETGSRSAFRVSGATPHRI
jgi:hypothetical protein